MTWWWWWCGLSSDYRTTPVNIVQLCTGLGCGNTEENNFDKKMNCETNCGYGDEMEETGNMNDEIHEVWNDDCGQNDDIDEPVTPPLNMCAFQSN